MEVLHLHGVRHGGVAHHWPDGLPADVPPSLARLLRAVWVGVSEDGNDNRAYNLDATVAGIMNDGWAHVYRGTAFDPDDSASALPESVSASDNPDLYIFSDSLETVQFLLGHCCDTTILTQAYVFKQSIYSLSTSDRPAPCHADVLFKWLAVRAQDETRNLIYTFEWDIVKADNSGDLGADIVHDLPLTETVQLVRRWPEDFTELGDLTAYAGGRVGISVTIVDQDTADIVSVTQSTFRIPEVCDESSSAASESASESIPVVGFTPNMRMVARPTLGHMQMSFDFDVSHDSTGWVNWGDGTPDEAMDSAGSGEFTTSHIYTVPGTYHVQVRMDDPTALHDIQVSGAADTQLDAYEFLVPFPNCVAVNMTQNTGMTRFSVINLPACTDYTFNLDSFPQAEMDQIILDLDNVGPQNGSLVFDDQTTGDVPTVGADAYQDLVNFQGWTITHD